MRKLSLNSSTALCSTLGNSPLVRELMNNALHRGKESAEVRRLTGLKRDASKSAYVDEIHYGGNFEGQYMKTDGTLGPRMIAHPK